MYSVVLMMALSGGADAVECHRNACTGGNGGCVGAAPVVVAAPASCTGCVGGNGCNGGGLFHRRHHGCDGGSGCHGGGLFKGGLFHRRHGCDGGCAGSAPAPVAAPCCGDAAPAPAPAPAPAGKAASLPVAPTVFANSFTTPARVSAPVVVNSQPIALIARR